MASNELSHLAGPVLNQSISSLTLEYNDFRSLSDLSCLANLPNLTYLGLKGSSISSVNEGSRTNTSVQLRFSPQVTTVHLSYNDIQKWSFINALTDIFPGLANLRTSHNPIYNQSPGGDAAIPMTADEAHMLTLSRIGGLTILNFSSISPQERSNAELYYLAQVAKAISAVPEIEAQTVIAQHPRYNELCSIYGSPAISRSEVDQIYKANALAHRLIKFTFYVPGGLEKSKEIPRGFDIYRLKGVVGRLMGMKPMELRLIWETDELDPVQDVAHEGEKDDAYDSEDDTGADRVEGKESAEEKRVKSRVELVDSTREVGFWIEHSEARVRVERV